MSTQQPEALRLADWLEAGVRTKPMREAASELRRLHAANEELLAALQLSYAELSSQWTPYIRANEKSVTAMKAARAAIAKAGGREA